MCLYLAKSSKTPPKPRIAEKDIYVYKVLSVNHKGVASSPYRDAPYKLNYVMTSRLMPERSYNGWNYDGLWHVNVGLHTMASRAAGIREVRSLGSNHMSKFLFVAVIPEGAEYFRGEFNDRNDSYASNRLIVLDRNHPESLKRLANK